ncbi:hypothetical protein [Sphingomonas sp. CARO-RG-8B-R24-01]|uniref:hypothetical protein n=1 Tax=Sphingomonas sp. CARO-RG-8B-R24-01 TaxID=2914831 RepID=UPI001F59916A|nr:hypothetical protein [Sphingomonas sp. CARO-RG-8B-R24-01]
MMATMSTVWDRTSAFVADHLAALAPIVLFGMFVPLALIGNLVAVMGAVGLTGGWVVGVVIVLLSLASNWGAIAVTALALDPAAGRSGAIHTTNHRFLPVVGVNVLALIALFVLFLPGMVGFSLSGIPMTQMTGEQPSLDAINGPMVLFATLYTLVLLPVLLWLVARLSVLNATMVAERRGPGVFGRSFALTRGSALKIMGVLLLYLLVSQIAGLAARMVAGAVFGLLLGGVGPLSASAILTALVVAMVSTLFSVLAVVFLAKLYLALRDARAPILEAA